MSCHIQAGVKDALQPDAWETQATSTPVAKAEHLLLFGLDACEEAVDAIHAADALQHAQHGLVCAAVQRPIQRANGSCGP